MTVTVRAKWTDNRQYIYNYGNEHSSITGGYEVYYPSATSTEGYLSATKESDHLSIKVLSNSSGIARWLGLKTSNNIKISHSILHLEYIFVVSWDNLKSVAVCDTWYQIPGSATKTTIDIDISEYIGQTCPIAFLNYTGSYHYAGEYLYVYQAYLE